MGLLTKIFAGHVIQLDGPRAKGKAADAVRPLIDKLRKGTTIEVRSVATADYLEGVIPRDRLDEYCRMFEEVLGPPAKRFDQRAKFEGRLQELVDSRGGILKNQSLYLRRYQDNRVAFAALWPWSDLNQITIKVGVYDQELPLES